MMIRCLMIGAFLSAQTALAGGLAVVDFNKAGSLVREGAKMQAELEELKADRGQRLKEIAHIQTLCGFSAHVVPKPAEWPAGVRRRARQPPSGPVNVRKQKQGAKGRGSRGRVEAA